jgi:hypothetical protein
MTIEATQKTKMQITTGGEDRILPSDALSFVELDWNNLPLVHATAAASGAVTAMIKPRAPAYGPGTKNRVLHNTHRRKISTININHLRKRTARTERGVVTTSSAFMHFPLTHEF